MAAQAGSQSTVVVSQTGPIYDGNGKELAVDVQRNFAPGVMAGFLSQSCLYHEMRQWFQSRVKFIGSVIWKGVSLTESSIANTWNALDKPTWMLSIR
eukprot:scaffold39385_cov62-Cyclotella_meneghiniana.AAC.1